MEPALDQNAMWWIIAAFIILCIFLGVRIVPQSEKHVVERFGRLRAVLGRGSISSSPSLTACATRSRC